MAERGIMMTGQIILTLHQGLTPRHAKGSFIVQFFQLMLPAPLVSCDPDWGLSMRFPYAPA